MMFAQGAFDICCEWGAAGAEQLAPISDVVIIVDVFSFTTSVEIAIHRGATIFPYARHDDSAARFAASMGAQLAGTWQLAGYSLSPQSLLEIASGTRLVLPSPNGATISLATGSTPTLAGCLRNASAVAQAAQRMGNRIAIIPAGERWPDGKLRPAFEDWICAGAIIGELAGTRSPESLAALGSSRAVLPDLMTHLQQCGSGHEQIARGLEANVKLAGAMNVSEAVPLLRNGAYTAFVDKEAQG